MFIINNEIWYIKFVSSHHPALYRSDNSLAIAVCDDKEKTIFINRNLQGKLLKKVICHEVVHAAMFSYNVELSIQQEELLCDIIATYGEEIINITNYLFLKFEGRVR